MRSRREEEVEAGTAITDPGLDEIFREFKKGVEKQLGSEDYDTRHSVLTAQARPYDWHYGDADERRREENPYWRD